MKPTPVSTIITHSDPQSAASEAFRVLRTNLQFLGLDKPLKSLLITSATPSEGKSTTASNLAVSFAQAGARVCLVDADLRRPMVAKMFGLENWMGLTTVLVNPETLTDALQETAIPDLWVLPSGPIPPNPAELMSSGRMKQVLEALEQGFDLVVVDTPPVLAVTDAAALAPAVSGVLMVIRSGVVDRTQAQRAKSALEAVGARVLGAVLGAVEEADNNGYYYYYYYYGDRTNGSRSRH